MAKSLKSSKAIPNTVKKATRKGGRVNLEAEFRKADMIAPRFGEGGKAKKKSKGYGERIDGTEKERGFLGEIRLPDGRDVMTEVSVGMPNTDELFRPSIISGMHPADLNYLRETGIVPEDLYQASLLHAQKRIKEGKSPFWNAKEDIPRYAKGGSNSLKDLFNKERVRAELQRMLPYSEPDPNSVIDTLLAKHDLNKAYELMGKNIEEFIKKGQTPEGALDIGLGMGVGSIEKVGKELANKVARSAKYTKKGAIQSNLRDMPFEDALALAQKGVHLKQDPTGQFVGAPRGVKSLRDINKIRSEYDKMVEEGALGGDWYERAQQFHKEYTPSKEAATEASRANALFSAQAEPSTNLGFTLQAQNAFEAGAPQKIVRTGKQASTYNKSMEAGKDIPLGKKTGVYAKYIDPSEGIGSTGVNDFRHARNLGYTQIDKKTGEAIPIKRGLSAQEHAWMDAETILATERANAKKLAGRDDWTPEEIQAAPWVLQKAQALMESSPKRFPTLESAMAEANKTYLEAVPKYQAFSTYEQIPYSTSGHLTNIENMPFDLKKEFSDFSNWYKTGGKDLLSQSVGQKRGMMTGKTQSGYGSYTNPETGITEINPQYQARSLVGMRPGEFGPELQPQSKAMMDAMNALRGYVDVQGASTWMKPLPGKVADSKSLHLEIKEPLTEAQMKELTDLSKAEGFNGVVDLGKEGVFIGFNDNITSGQDLTKLLKSGFQDKLKEVLEGKLDKVSRVRVESGYPSYEGVFGKEHEGTGAATKQLFDYLEEAKSIAPKVTERMESNVPEEFANLLQSMNARDLAAQELYKDFGVGAPRQDILNARNILSKSGLQGLKEAMESGAYLPAAFVLPDVLGGSGEE